MSKSDDRARLAQLETAFGRLRPKHREIILLARVDGLTYAEIGERLGLTIDQVERRMAKAIYALDRALHPPKRPWRRFWWARKIGLAGRGPARIVGRGK